MVLPDPRAAAFSRFPVERKHLSGRCGLISGSRSERSLSARRWWEFPPFLGRPRKTISSVRFLSAEIRVRRRQSSSVTFRHHPTPTVIVRQGSSVAAHHLPSRLLDVRQFSVALNRWKVAVSRRPSPSDIIRHRQSGTSVVVHLSTVGSCRFSRIRSGRTKEHQSHESADNKGREGPKSTVPCWQLPSRLFYWRFPGETNKR